MCAMLALHGDIAIAIVLNRGNKIKHKKQNNSQTLFLPPKKPVRISLNFFKIISQLNLIIKINKYYSRSHIIINIDIQLEDTSSGFQLV